MKTNEHLRASILDYIPLNIFITNLQGIIRYVNKYGCESIGSDNESLSGTNVQTFLHDREGEESWTDSLKTVKQTTTLTGKIDFIKKDRSAEICDFHLFKMAEEDNNALILILHDITRQIENAQQLEHKNFEMAKMNSELIRSNAQLKRVSELKSNFLSIASHELKTPLTSIKGYSDIIIDNMEGKMESGIYRMIGSINRAADRLHRVVNNILDVTRIEQKRLRLRPENIDLTKIIRDCIDELSQFTVERGISIDCTFGKNLPFFYGDKMRMQQVFTNLFTNALKFSPDNSSIEVSFVLTDDKQFHITVRDHGIGINADEQKKIFHPFYEVASINRHSTHGSKFMGGGTGLGLSIVKGIIERHRGKVWVISEGVKDGDFPGSEFNIMLPVRPGIHWDDDESKAASVMNPLDSEVAEENLQRIDEKPKILFIDEDQEAVEIARIILEKAFEVVVAKSGEEGLQKAFEIRPTIILLDSYLPGLDGYRVCNILRSQQETRDLPIAFFSAGTQTDEIQRGFECGADDFIVKPFSGKELMEKIWRLIMKKKEMNVSSLV